MTSKLRLKIGPIEVEYEGSEQFLKEEFPEFLKAVTTLYERSGLPSDNDSPSPPAATGPRAPMSGTTGTFAAKLGAGTGTDLALCAAARLQIGLQHTSFSRAQLLKEMQSAPSYYKKSYSGNLSKILSTLIANHKLIESAKDTYSIAAATEKEVRAKLG